ncbi:MAG: dephospho-CoA kinase [Dehalococcoidia bacterium]
MFIIGLTGGIGTGKSTVAGVLQKEGAAIVNADVVGHEVYQVGRPAYHEVIHAFGEGVLDADKAIDRKKLGAIVFGDPKELAKLNSIVHPRMKGMMREKLQELQRSGAKIAVIEAAILFEARWDDLANETWVTSAPPEIASRRVAERSGFTQDQVMERIRAQMPNDERVQRADIVIDTSEDMEQTIARTLEKWEELQRRLPDA